MKQAVCGILQIGNRFVAVKRKDKESYGLIGGKVDNGETLEEALIRETLEETGFSVSISPYTVPFTAIDENGYEVTTFLLSLNQSQHIHIDTTKEVAIIYLLDKNQLIEMSDFGEYNRKAFKHYLINKDIQ